MPQLLNAIDVCTLTSHNEANPVSILESLACGVPVVATRVGSVHETVIPDQTGYLIAPGSVTELAERVHALFADPTCRYRMGEAGRRLVESDWSLDRMVRGYEELITGIYESKCGERVRLLPLAADACAS